MRIEARDNNDRDIVLTENGKRVPGKTTVVNVYFSDDEIALMAIKSENLTTKQIFERLTLQDSLFKEFTSHLNRNKI